VVVAAVVAVEPATEGKGDVEAVVMTLDVSARDVVGPVVFPVDPHPKSVSNATPRAAVQRHPMAEH
jgi:hypothetical protein